MDAITWKDFPHVYMMQQFSAQALEGIIQHSIKFEEAMQAGQSLPRISDQRYRMVRTLFWEPSTRTEATFIGAATQLDCDYHAVQDPSKFSSGAKGESLSYAIAAYTHTGGMRLLRQCDCLVVRHPQRGASRKIAGIIDTAQSDIPLPVINAGDGDGQHPTQALVDLTTIYRERRSCDHPLYNATVLFPGDLQRSRVVNSLLYAFGRIGGGHNIKVIFCCPKGFGPKRNLLEFLARHDVAYSFRYKKKDFRDSIGEADIVFMTRSQRERIGKKEQALSFKQRTAYAFQANYVERLKPDAIVMHPLPINEDPKDPPPEIDPALFPLAMSGHPNLVWLRQSHRGMPVRAALMDIMFANLDARNKQ